MADTIPEYGPPGPPSRRHTVQPRPGRRPGTVRATEVAGSLEFGRTGHDRRFLPRGVRSMVLMGSMSLSHEEGVLGQDPTTGGTVLLGAGHPGDRRPRPEPATRALWRRLMALPPLDEPRPAPHRR